MKTYMNYLKKLGGIAALANVVVAMATLATVFFLIGIPAITDPTKLIDMAIQNPTPLLIQDALKLVSAVISIVLILAISDYLWNCVSAARIIATGFGLLSVLCLLGNASLSVYAISQRYTHNQSVLSGNHLNDAIGILAIAALGLNGLWFLLLSRAALKHRKLPVLLCYLGFSIGILSLIPPLGIIVLLLSVVWSAWMGQVLLTKKSTDK